MRATKVMLRILGILLLLVPVVFFGLGFVNIFTGFGPADVTVREGAGLDEWAFFLGAVVSFSVVWPLVGIVYLITSSPRTRRFFLSLGWLSIFLSLAIGALAISFVRFTPEGTILFNPSYSKAEPSPFYFTLSLPLVFLGLSLSLVAIFSLVREMARSLRRR